MHEALRRYSEKIDDVMLAYWASMGFDDRRNLFVERLNLQGRPICDIPHRAMVQARQIFVFADAARTGRLSIGGELALKALDGLLGRYCDEGDPSHGIAFSVAYDGTVLAERRDAYTHAFVLFALAAVHRMSQDRKYLHMAARLNAFVELHLTDPLYFGLYSSAPATTTEKAQNPLMHLLEAYLALHETCPTGEYLQKASGIVRLFEQKLFRNDEGVLPEYFARDWTEHPHPHFGRFFEPGHHFEWVWLLSRFDRMAQTDHSTISDVLWETACRTGITPTGHCYDAVNFEYSPVKRSTRLWPHTEGAKAAGARFDKDPAASGIAKSMLLALNSDFLGEPFAAGWIDHLDPDGAPLVDYVPASSLYHLYLANAELSQLPQVTGNVIEPATEGGNR